MSQPIKRHLKVGGAPEYDEPELLVRMHPDDLPKGIRWNTYINVSTKNATVACKVRNNRLAEVPEPRIHQININRHLRNLLSVKSGTVYDFYVTKGSFWKAPAYIMQYHPSRTARRNTVLKIVAAVAGLLIIVGGVLYYFLGYR